MLWCKIYIADFALHSVHYIVYIALCTLNNAHCTVYIAYFALHTVYIALCAHFTLCRLHSVDCKLFPPHLSLDHLRCLLLSLTVSYWIECRNDVIDWCTVPGITFMQHFRHHCFCIYNVCCTYIIRIALRMFRKRNNNPTRSCHLL